MLLNNKNSPKGLIIWKSLSLGKNAKDTKIVCIKTVLQAKISQYGLTDFLKIHHKESRVLQAFVKISKNRKGQENQSEEMSF